MSKESLFLDLNNQRVVTPTSEAYNTCFGFTEEEVFAALDSYGMSGEKEKVKKWYDGFVYGSVRDIYNNYLREFQGENDVYAIVIDRDYKSHTVLQCKVYYMSYSNY